MSLYNLASGELKKENHRLEAEIERLNKQIEEYQKALDETTSEKMDLENIIKEAREYIEHTQNYGKEKIIYVNGTDILEILDKENK